jgi:hypothetical protein
LLEKQEMPISYKDIKGERQWKASTGLTSEKFHELVKVFGRFYEQVFGESLEERQSKSTSASTFTTYGDLLFFGLYSIRSGLTYDLLGLTFGLDAANVYKNQSIVLRVLDTALTQTGLMPKRSFDSEEDFKAYLGKEQTVLIDVTEQRRQRPGDKEEQKSDYSGKKSAYGKDAGNRGRPRPDIVCGQGIQWGCARRIFSIIQLEMIFLTA